MNALSIALSGMQAAQVQMNAAAQNVANLQTQNYQPVRADIIDLSSGGVNADLQSSPVPASGAPTSPGSNVDLAAEMINMKLAQLAFGANADVVRTENHTLGSLLDMYDTDPRN